MTEIRRFLSQFLESSKNSLKILPSITTTTKLVIVLCLKNKFQFHEKNNLKDQLF